MTADAKAAFPSTRAAYLPNCGIVPGFPELTQDVCPWAFPILIHGYQNFHLSLRDEKHG
jgi:hypothetical protein